MYVITLGRVEPGALGLSQVLIGAACLKPGWVEVLDLAHVKGS